MTKKEEPQKIHLRTFHVPKKDDPLFHTVPLEYHDQQIKERDKKIAELQKVIQDEDAADLIEQYKNQPQPARKGWFDWVFFVAGILVGITIGFALSFRIPPAAFKGTVDATGYHVNPAFHTIELHQVGDWVYADEHYMDHTDNAASGIRIDESERDHWLRNDRASYRALGCADRSVVKNIRMGNACESLDR